MDNKQMLQLLSGQTAGAKLVANLHGRNSQTGESISLQIDENMVLAMRPLATTLVKSGYDSVSVTDKHGAPSNVSAFDKDAEDDTPSVSDDIDSMVCTLDKLKAVLDGGDTLPDLDIERLQTIKSTLADIVDIAGDTDTPDSDTDQSATVDDDEPTTLPDGSVTEADIKSTAQHANPGETGTSNVQTPDYSDSAHDQKVEDSGTLDYDVAVKVPSEIIKSIDKRVKELSDTIDKDTRNENTFGQVSPLHNAITLLGDLKKMLTDCDVEKLKMAKIEIDKASSPIRDILPANLFKFLKNA